MTRLFAILILSTLSAMGANTLNTGGLRLDLSDTGQVTNLVVGTVPVTLTANGGFQLADFAVSATTYNAVTGVIASTNSGYVVTATNSTVRLEATLTTNQSTILIQGTLTNQAASDRAVALRFALPFDAASWIWHDDMVTTRTISSASVYRNTPVCTAGDGVRSLYPIGPISDTSGTNGLAMAWPMTIGPQTFVFGYDNTAKEFQYTVYLALSTNALKFANSATFSFVLYPAAGTNAFRSGLETYYGLYPSVFTKRPTYEAAYGYADEVFNAANHRLVIGADQFNDMSDFGEGFGKVTHVHGVSYDAYWPTNSVTLPPDANTRAWLLTLPAMGDLYSGAGAEPQLAETDAYAISYISTSYEPAVPQWVLGFRVNQDPEVSTGLTDKTSTEVTAYFATPRAPFSTSVTSDWAEGGQGSYYMDYDTNHLAKSDFPPTFGTSSLKPAVMNQLWDWYSAYLWPLSTNNQFVITGNSGDADDLFTTPFIDINMSEGPRSSAWLRFFRAIAYQKIWRNWTTITPAPGVVYTDAQFRSELMNCLALGFYPSLGMTAAGGMTETFRPYYRAYLPAIEELSAAGWQPVTYAISSSASATVERFGAGTNLHFSVQNTTAGTISTTITMDLANLGLTGQILSGRDLVASNVITVTGATFPVTLTNSQTKAFWVGPRDQSWIRAVWLVNADIGKLRRTFTNELVAADNTRINAFSAQLAALTSQLAFNGSYASLIAAVNGIKTNITTASSGDLTKQTTRIKDRLGQGLSTGNMRVANLRVGQLRGR